jgi:threonine synthase
VAVTRKLVEQGRVKADDLTVIAITGNGLKTAEALRVQQPISIEPRVSSFEQAISGLRRKREGLNSRVI